jgi:stress response protein SCP2
MAINFPGNKSTLPSKIWIGIGIEIEYMPPKKSFYERFANIIKADFDIGVLALDINKNLPNDKCFIFYNQPSSNGVDLNPSTLYDIYKQEVKKFNNGFKYSANDDGLNRNFEFISIDFNEIIQDIHSLKFILSNYNNTIVKNSKIQCIIYDNTIGTGPNGIELFNFIINLESKFQLMELFEINLFNTRDWYLNVLENSFIDESEDTLTNYLSNFINKNSR